MASPPDRATARPAGQARPGFSGATFFWNALLFTRAVRAAGIETDPGGAIDYSRALSLIDIGDREQVRACGLALFVRRRDEVPVYDEVFRRFFLGEASSVPEPLRVAMHDGAEGQSVLQVPATEPGSGEGEEQEARLGLMASDAEVLRHKSFASCTPEELAALRRIMVRIRLVPPRRRTRRTAPAPLPEPTPAD